MWHLVYMPKKNSSNPGGSGRPKMAAVGSILEHTAEAMTLTSDPGKRDAAARWLKIIRRQLAKEARQSGPDADNQQAA